MNLNLMKCYKVLFTKSGIISNVGSYIVILIILFYFLSIIIFYKKDKNRIEIIIKEIVYAKKSLSDLNIEQNINKDIENMEIQLTKNKKYSTIINKKQEKIIKNTILKNTEINSPKNGKESQKIKKRKSALIIPREKSSKKDVLKNIEIKKEEILENKRNSNMSIKKINEQNPPIKSKKRRNSSININKKKISIEISNNSNKQFEMSNNIITSGNNNKIIDELTKNKEKLMENKILSFNDYELNTLDYL